MGRKKRKLVTLSERFVPQFWDEADGRTAIVKEIRNRVERLKADTQCDSYQKEILCQRVIFITALLESMEIEVCSESAGVALQNGRLSAGTYTQMTNTLIGLLKSLGLERKAKKVESLQTYINKKRK